MASPLDANRGGGSHFSVTVPISDKVTYIGTIANVMAASRMPAGGRADRLRRERPRRSSTAMRTLLTGWGRRG